MKKFLTVLVVLLLFISVPIGADGDLKVATKSAQPFNLDGFDVSIGGYLIEGSNYFKLRDIAAFINGTDSEFNVGYDEINKQIKLELGSGYEKLDTDLIEMKHDKTEAKMVTNTILVDGKEAKLSGAFIDGNNYVKLRDLGEVVGFKVDFDEATRKIIVNTNDDKGKIKPNLSINKENLVDAFNSGKILDFDAFSNKFLELLNEERNRTGAGDLKIVSYLKKGTDLRAEELADFGHIRTGENLEAKHKRLDGKSNFRTAFSYMNRYDIDECRSLGENLVEQSFLNSLKLDDGTWIKQEDFLKNSDLVATKLFNIWKSSPGHYKNMINKDSVGTYVSVRLGKSKKLNGGYTLIGVEIFDLKDED